MKTYLAQKQSKDEIGINSLTSFRFEAYLAGCHESLIFDLLDPNGIFLGKLNRHQFICWLTLKFKALKQPMYNCDVKRFISMDQLPGSEVISIRYKNNSENFTPFEDFEPINYNENLDLELNLVLSFNNGKINQILVSKHFIQPEQVEELTKN